MVDIGPGENITVELSLSSDVEAGEYEILITAGDNVVMKDIIVEPQDSTNIS